MLFFIVLSLKLCSDSILCLVIKQKWSSCSWLLLREFVKRRQEDEKEVLEKIAAGERTPEDLESLPLPKIPYVRRRDFALNPSIDSTDWARFFLVSVSADHDTP